MEKIKWIMSYFGLLVISETRVVVNNLTNSQVWTFDG